MSKMTEQEFAEPIVAWLQQEGWEVYQEVSMYVGGPIVDIVAKRDGVLWAIECKISMTATLCGQAYRLQGLSRFNQVSVAVPDITKSHSYAQKFLRQGLQASGIGTVHLRFDLGTKEPMPYVYQFASHTPNKDLVSFTINEAQKTWAKAGNADGKRWTPFQQTVENVKVFLFKGVNNEYTMKAIVEGIEHHYKTDARAQKSLRVWFDAGLVQGIMSTGGNPYTVTRYYLDWAKRRANIEQQ